MLKVYPAIFEKDKVGYGIFFPDVENAVTQGETTATSIIGELGDIRRFKSSNQINAFIGIDLRHYQSGDYLAQEHITKRGNPYARKILFKAIHNIVSTRVTLRTFMGKEKGNRLTLPQSPIRLPLCTDLFDVCTISLCTIRIMITL